MRALVKEPLFYVPLTLVMAEIRPWIGLLFLTLLLLAGPPLLALYIYRQSPQPEEKLGERYLRILRKEVSLLGAGLLVFLLLIRIFYPLATLLLAAASVVVLVLAYKRISRKADS
ncbi:MAG: hypothetical protein HY520_01420 [Candidatus Aenigmarchaeota archaeon]|nr:hypothetical protein [Candidatus Aenigmarchaeota archaeon]